MFQSPLRGEAAATRQECYVPLSLSNGSFNPLCGERRLQPFSNADLFQMLDAITMFQSPLRGEAAATR